MKTRLIDRKYRNVRVWSNDELKKIAHHFTGSVCNVSAWRDQDKEGKCYKDYFTNASSYLITNYHKSPARGAQKDLPNQILLDLEKDLEPDMEEQFDVVYNHTTLEHVFECQKAFKNLCLLSKDIVILVVPFLQETHADYGDYWRYTPQGMDKLFKSNGMTTVYYNRNDQGSDSIYLFCVGAKNPEQWHQLVNTPGNKTECIYTEFVGTQIIKNSFFDWIKNRFITLFN
tara:strand:+ start:2136 stop:2822 length:687 start_codon:yes stop_codon:yes gene_type:complete